MNIRGKSDKWDSEEKKINRRDVEKNSVIKIKEKKIKKVRTVKNEKGNHWKKRERIRVE